MSSSLTLVHPPVTEESPFLPVLRHDDEFITWINSLTEITEEGGSDATFLLR